LTESNSGTSIGSTTGDKTLSSSNISSTTRPNFSTNLDQTQLLLNDGIGDNYLHLNECKSLDVNQQNCNYLKNGHHSTSSNHESTNQPLLTTNKSIYWNQFEEKSIYNKERLSSIPTCPPPPPPINNASYERNDVTMDDDDVFEPSVSNIQKTKKEADNRIHTLNKTVPSSTNQRYPNMTESSPNQTLIRSPSHGHIKSSSSGENSCIFSFIHQNSQQNYVNATDAVAAVYGKRTISSARNDTMSSSSPSAYLSPPFTPHQGAFHHLSSSSIDKSPNPRNQQPSLLQMVVERPQQMVHYGQEGSKIRRSSSVGQLENYVNEIPSITTNQRRRSIDNQFKSIFNADQIDLSTIPRVPPPRPPKPALGSFVNLPKDLNVDFLDDMKEGVSVRRKTTSSSSSTKATKSSLADLIPPLKNSTSSTETAHQYENLDLSEKSYELMNKINPSGGKTDLNQNKSDFQTHQNTEDSYEDMVPLTYLSKPPTNRQPPPPVKRELKPVYIPTYKPPSSHISSASSSLFNNGCFSPIIDLSKGKTILVSAPPRPPKSSSQSSGSPRTPLSEFGKYVPERPPKPSVLTAEEKIIVTTNIVS